MLKRYPDSYRIDVYKTHRTAAAPQWVYDNTSKNATRAKLNGDVVEGAYGGIPFPIAKTGAEVIWNHMLRWRGTSWEFDINQYQLTADGKAVLTTDGRAEQQMPYYFNDGSAEAFAKSNDFWLIRLVNAGPPIRAGEAVLGRENLDGSKSQGWVYLTGQRTFVTQERTDDPGPIRGSGLAGDRAHRHAQGLRRPGTVRAGDAEARSAWWSSVCLPGSARRSHQGALARRARPVTLRQAT